MRRRRARASPIARCATAARSAAAWPMPIRRRTGSPCCRRSAPRRSRSARRASGASPRRTSSRGVFETALAPRRARCAPSSCRCCRADARWGHWKFCRKAGEFSKAIGLRAGAARRSAPRAVLAALDGPPLVIGDAAGADGGAGRPKPRASLPAFSASTSLARAPCPSGAAPRRAMAGGMSTIARSRSPSTARRVRLLAEPRTQLADLLREQLLLTGTHLGCEHGVCGACTVEIDGAPARSCITHAGSCDGAGDAHHRGLRRRRASWPHCARPSARARAAMRLLHAGHAGHRARHRAAAARSRRGAACARRWRAISAAAPAIAASSAPCCGCWPPAGRRAEATAFVGLARRNSLETRSSCPVRASFNPCVDDLPRHRARPGRRS